MSQKDEPKWITDRVRDMETRGDLIKMPLGWEPPPIKFDDICSLSSKEAS